MSAVGYWCLLTGAYSLVLTGGTELSAAICLPLGLNVLCPPAACCRFASRSWPRLAGAQRASCNPPISNLNPQTLLQVQVLHDCQGGAGLVSRACLRPAGAAAAGVVCGAALGAPSRKAMGAWPARRAASTSEWARLATSSKRPHPGWLASASA